MDDEESGYPIESHRLIVSDLQDYTNISDFMDQWKKMGILPIDTVNHTTVNDLNLSSINPLVEVLNLLVLAGDLLACEAITVKEWHKLKMLIQSENIENNKLAEEILKAKAE